MYRDRVTRPACRRLPNGGSNLNECESPAHWHCCHGQRCKILIGGLRLVSPAVCSHPHRPHSVIQALFRKVLNPSVRGTVRSRWIQRLLERAGDCFLYLFGIRIAGLSMSKSICDFAPTLPNPRNGQFCCLFIRMERISRNACKEPGLAHMEGSSQQPAASSTKQIS